MLKMNRKDLMNDTDIWNAVVEVISEYDFPEEKKPLKETFLVFQYYTELESGGHEMLLTWFSDYIQEVGIKTYRNELIDILEEIGAHDYAVIAQEYLEQLWEKYVALETDENEEAAFYTVIENADADYNLLNGELENLLESYFAKIHKDLITVIED